MNYSWLLLDADNTLFDYDRAEAEALRRTFEALGDGYEPRYAGVYRQINGQIWRQFEQGIITQQRLRTRRFELLFEALGVELDPAEFSRRYLDFLGQGTCLLDGAEEVVRALYGRVGLLIITNGLQEVQRPRLANSAIGAYMDGVVISDEVGVSKPEPGIFDIAFEKMGHPAKGDVLMVGDSLTSDMPGGIAYGIDTCWYNPEQYPRPAELDIRYEIQHLAGLLPIVEG
jgi:YjjG family noncanonical pyrimidine nucleotidase